jgi:hypothetical protein
MQQRNDTANQHYVSQVEQRLNSLNPNSAPRNRRIYSFTLVDREEFALSLDSSQGCLISKSFDVIHDNRLGR